MSRRPALFRPAEITRAVVAVEKAGKTVSRVEIDHAGSLVMVCAGEDDDAPAGGALDLVAIARGEDGAKGKRARRS